MAILEFATDPGPFPITTIRDYVKWAPRLAGLEQIEVKGVHGCTLKYEMVRIVKIEDYAGPVPAHLSFYQGKRLLAVTLDRLIASPARAE